MYQKNQVIEGYYDDGWYPGIVYDINEDNTYVVHFDDGDVLDDMRDEEIRLPQQGNSPQYDANDSNENIFEDEFKESTGGFQSNVNVEDVLKNVESFLLPSPKKEQANDFEDLPPCKRLEALLKELSIGEHLRMLQYLCRDTEDELHVGGEVRGENTMRVTSKNLTENLTEGRARAVALSRICFGDDSIESLRALVDLGSIYAAQGLWEQVSFHMGVASQKLVAVSQKMHASEVRSKSHDASLYTFTVFNCLREHAMAHRGYITPDFLTEVSSALNAAAASALATRQAQQRQQELYDELFPESSITGEDEIRPSEDKTVGAVFCHEMEVFLCRHMGPRDKWAEVQVQTPPSWGQVVQFLTSESAVIAKWMELIDMIVLPQNKAVLHMAFVIGDKERRGVCHPVELAMNINKIPSAARVLSGTQVMTDLSKLRVDLPIAVSASDGSVFTFSAPELKDLFGQRRHLVQNVKYELPVVWEEFIAQVVFASNTEGGGDPLDLLRIQILNLIGLSNVFSNQLSLAEENMRSALGKLEAMGLEMELISVDLYNAISQLMVVKHRQWHAEKKTRCMKAAEKWLKTREGRQVLQSEIKAVRTHYLHKKKMQLSSKTSEEIATKFAVKLRAKYIMKSEEDPTTQSLEASYRYLVRSFEILERTHGENIAVASASLAVASVQNIIGNYGESKEWLVRAIRIMEKLSPVPVRAIAFTQTQLSSVLIKLNHPKSAEKVLSAAVDFYSGAAMKQLNRSSRLNALSVSSIYAGVNRSPQLMSDIETSLDLLRRLMDLSIENGAKWQAAEYAETMAELGEAAYGWDSQEVAALRQQVSIVEFVVLQTLLLFCVGRREAVPCERLGPSLWKL